MFDIRYWTWWEWTLTGCAIGIILFIGGCLYVKGICTPVKPEMVIDVKYTAPYTTTTYHRVGDVSYPTTYFHPEVFQKVVASRWSRSMDSCKCYYKISETEYEELRHQLKRGDF